MTKTLITTSCNFGLKIRSKNLECASKHVQGSYVSSTRFKRGITGEFLWKSLNETLHHALEII